MNVDLNQLIPAFLAADDERRRRVMAVLTESDKDQEIKAVNPGPEWLLCRAIPCGVGLFPCLHNAEMTPADIG